MKKYLIAAVLLLGGAWIIRAEQAETPTGPIQALASADYGGYYSTTSLFNTQISTIVSNPNGQQGVFAGVIFSSGNCGSIDFVDIFDSTSPPVNAAQRNEAYLTRQYNVNNSTGLTPIGCSGFSGPPRPIKFRRGLFAQPGQATYNGLTILFYTKP